MTDQRPYPDAGDDRGEDTGVIATEDRPPSMPRWVKVSGIIVIGLILLLVIGLFIGGGQHGPRRHVPGGGTPGGVTPSGGHTPPWGGR